MKKRLQGLIVDIDKYGEAPNFTFSVDQPELKTSIGSILTILTAIIMIMHSMKEFLEIYNRSEKTYF
jgi:hypothetical protein